MPSKDYKAVRLKISFGNIIEQIGADFDWNYHPEAL